MTDKINELQKKIDELTNELEEEKEELAKSNLDPNDIELAELLHNYLCHHNHTDGCGWYYESWDKPGWSKNWYLEKAHKLHENGFIYKDVKLFLEIID